MADEQRNHPPPRARAVAELGVEALLARTDELARRWAVALLLARPLGELGGLALEELARDAPALCAQVLRAVRSDAELERLAVRDEPVREPVAGAHGVAAMCAADGAAALVEAVEALRGVLWEALLDALREPPARLLADVGDRLAYVCASMLASCLDAGAPTAAASARKAGSEPASPTPEPAIVAMSRGDVVIIDERAAPGLAGEPVAEIEIRDERREEGPAAWIASISARLADFERDGAPFAVLLVELADVERLRRQGPPEELMRMAGSLERALTAAVARSHGSLARERPGRCWLLVPWTDRAGAERLAQQLTRELPAGSGAQQAPPLSVAIGTATCPEDGREAAALAAHADVGLYAARSARRAAHVRAAAPPDDL